MKDIKVVVNGAGGRMGREVVKAVSGTPGMSVAAAVDRGSFASDVPAYTSLSDVKEECDVIIDFSHHTAAESVISFALSRGIPAVIATTGHTEEERRLITDASKKIPIFFSANMSVGIALLIVLTKTAVKAFPDADVEIVEIHHNNKLDVPSGTALMLAEAVKDVRRDVIFRIGRHENGKRLPEEVGIHSLRLGNTVGTHEIIISTANQTVTIKHEAHNRALFADGAVCAAKFIVGLPAGLYTVSDMIN